MAPRTKQHPSNDSSARIADTAAHLAVSKKAGRVRILDLKGLTDFADFFVICSGGSDLHVKAIVDAIEEGLKQETVKPWHIEGYQNLRWVLLDYVDVVVHVFDRETRDYYALEKLWGDAETREVSDSLA